jgi:hypothetical protein
VSFGKETALRAAGGLFALGLAWAAVGFLAFGIFEWLLLYLSTIGAAFATAGVCLLLTGAVVLIVVRGHSASPVIEPVQPQQQQQAPPGQRANLILALRELSTDHPILAVCAAAVLGAVGSAEEAKRR